MGRAKRAYLLMESATAGGILAVALSTSVVIVAHYRFETTMSARVQEASALAIAKADELVGTGLSNGAPPPDQPLTTDPAHPGFKVGYAIAPAGLQGASTPPLLQPSSLLEITVTVQYPSSTGPKQIVFKRLKRDRT